MIIAGVACLPPLRLVTHKERRATNAEGLRWTVREVGALDIPGSRSDFCLIFDNSSVCRRLWVYPEHWFSMADPALLALMDGPL